MIFEDVFYPDNPKRRQQVSELQAEARITFEGYKKTWNELAAIINPIFDDLNKNPEKKTDYAQLKLKTLNYDLRESNVEECLREIKEAVSDAKEKLDNLVKEIGIADLPDVSKIELNEEIKYRLYRGLAAIPSMVLSSFATFYAVRGFMLLTLIARAVGDTISSIARILGGVLSGLVVGGVTFILSDMIVSAITGAIERREMEEAITALKQLVEQVCVPLNNARNIIGGVIQNIKDGLYKLNDSTLLVRTEKDKNGKEIWSVIVISSAPQNSLESP